MPDGICPFTEFRPGVWGYSVGGMDKVGFCDHTAGGFYSTLRSINFWNSKGISVHFGCARDGRGVQLVNIFDRAYAQGRLGTVVNWPPYQQMNRVNPNEYLISTEHEDAITVNGVTKFVPGSEWTPEQYDIDLRIKQWCVEEFKRVKGIDIMPFGIDSLAGHHMFDNVDRPECPGRFWRNEYRGSLFRELTTVKDEEDEDMQIVTKTKTGYPDAYKCYLVVGKEYRHIPDADHFNSLVNTGLIIYDPDKRAWDFMTRDAKFIE